MTSEKIIDHTVKPQEREDVLQLANESHLVIFATHHYSSRPSYYGDTQIKLAEDLFNLSQNQSFSMILVSVENPYDLARIPTFNTTIVAFNSKPETIEALVSCITGELEFKGLMPIEQLQ